MAHTSRRFNFDDFDRQIAEALEEHELVAQNFDRVFGKYPGQIGGVALRLSSGSEADSDLDPVPDPPEAA